MIPILILSLKKRFFSQTSQITETTPVIYNESYFNEMTIRNIRIIAKKNGINLKCARKKADIIQIVVKHFAKFNTSVIELGPFPPVTFDIFLDKSRKLINISCWFKQTGKKLKRYIDSAEFQGLLAECCRDMNTTKENLMVYQDGDLYVHPILAVDSAASFDSRLRYDIYKYYILDLLNRQKEVYGRHIRDLEQQLAIAHIKAKLKPLRWTSFKLPYAFYYFSIGNVVKCGAVGLRNAANSDNLDLRLAAHRSTFARFELINIIQFSDSNSVTTFESWIKMHLEEYSIGALASIPLEQYECPNKITKDIINAKIMEEFESLPEHHCSLCPADKIKEYNELMAANYNSVTNKNNK